MSRNHEPYRNLPGQYSTDLVAAAALGFLEDAIKDSSRPFYLGVAPIAPHSETITNPRPARFNPPVPAKRHEHLFQNVTIPRKPNFNPDKVRIFSLLSSVKYSLSSFSQELHRTSKHSVNSTKPKSTTTTIGIGRDSSRSNPWTSSSTLYSSVWKPVPKS
jgi:N-acetylglucosamine-6-sulfatase